MGLLLRGGREGKGREREGNTKEREKGRERKVVRGGEVEGRGRHSLAQPLA